MRLEVEGLTKRYGSRLVLDGVSFAAEPGTVTVLTGGNGTGKSTILRCIVGLASSRGRMRLGDLALPGSRRARAAVGYLPQSPMLNPTATVAETITFYARLRGSEDAVEAFDDGFLPPEDAAVGSLSGGQRHRVACAVALLGRPSLVLLDEPLADLDEPGRDMVARAVARLADDGATVLIASPVADPVIRAGRTIALADGRMIDEHVVSSVAPAVTWSGDVVAGGQVSPA